MTQAKGQVFGLGFTLLDAVALADVWGSGTRIRLDSAAECELVAAFGAGLPAAMVDAAIARAAPHYILSCGNEILLPDLAGLAVVIDRLARASGAGFLALCLANPAWGRTVYQGHVFQDGKRLTDSLHDFRPEISGRVAVVPHEVVAQGEAALRRRLAALKEQGFALALVDAVSAPDFCAVRAAFAGQILAAGPAWLAEPAAADDFAAPAGRVAILAHAQDRQSLYQIGAARDKMPFLQFLGDVPGAVAWALAQSDDFMIEAAPGQEGAKILADIAAGLAASGQEQKFVLVGAALADAVLSGLGIAALTAGGIAQGLRWFSAKTHNFLIKPEGWGPKNLLVDGFGPQIRLNAAAE
jgi:uncharacterized protein YgbK (DUF1537 family)